MRNTTFYTIVCLLTGEVRDMMVMHQFDEYQMHETLTDANDILKSGYSSDSGLNSSVAGLSTVNEEPDDLQTHPSGVDIPQIVIRHGSTSSRGSNLSLTSDDVEFQKREEERIKEMYKVLNIERRKSVAKNKSDGLEIARDYVRRASTAQGLASGYTSGGEKSRPGSRGGSRVGSISGGLNPNEYPLSRRESRTTGLEVLRSGGQRRQSTIFMPPKTYKDKSSSVF